MYDEPSSEVAREIFLKWRLLRAAAAVPRIFEAALAITRVAEGYTSNIQLGHAGVACDAKDAMDVIMFLLDASSCLEAGAKMRFSARGTDALSAVGAIESVFSNPELDFDRSAERSD